jgi:hypothetical protein
MHYFGSLEKMCIKKKRRNPKMPISPSNFKTSQKRFKNSNQKYGELLYFIKKPHNYFHNFWTQ